MDELISIHAPREGGDILMCRPSPVAVAFQSTPPARGATDPIRSLNLNGDISIHAPREGGDCKARVAVNAAVISIHAPREGGDVGR